MAFWLRQRQHLAELRNASMDDLAAVMDNVDINRITYLGIAAGGIYLHDSFVESALAVGERCSEIVPGIRLTGLLGRVSIVL